MRASSGCRNEPSGTSAQTIRPAASAMAVPMVWLPGDDRNRRDVNAVRLNA